MINREHKLSVVRQAKLLGFSRGSLYYSPRPVCDGDLALMRRIDELHLDYPFAGSRMLQVLLKAEGLQTGRLHVATLMKKMGIEAIYGRPNTSKPAPGHKVYPYLLRKLAVTGPNQVWAMDISYIPWLAALSISAPSWTGSVVGFYRGGCRSRWRQPSASQQSRKRGPVMGNPTYSILTKVRSSPRWTSRRC